jgi:hypothetical protein
MQKFIHDNEQYVLEVKRKHGKTKIDKELNDYMRKKNINNYINLFNNTGNNNMNNNTNLNYQMMNNPILAMNYLLLQNQLLMQQQNQNLDNVLNNNINLIQNNEENNLSGNKESNADEKEEKNENENNIEVGNNQEGENLDETNKNNEIIKKILEAITDPNNINNEDKQGDPRQKGK